MRKLITSVREDTGPERVEYGLIVGLLAVVVISVVTLIGGDPQPVLRDFHDAL
ncbi:MAG: Flp family type IVb pilin [Pseudomonadota bacterium]